MAVEISACSTSVFNNAMAINDAQLTVIAKATDEFLEQVRAQEHRSPESLIEDFAQRYPAIRSNIEDLFPALVGIEKLARGSSRGNEAASFPELEDYEIVREVGRGGMGIVYEARQISLDRRVALKTLTLNTVERPGFLERFQREARVAASLHHSNIVPVYEVGFENGIHYFSMQFIEGINLSELCRYCRTNQITHAHTRKVAIGDDLDSTKDFNAQRTSTAIDGDPTAQRNVLTRLNADLTRLADQLSHADVARMGAQIADALHYIHQQSIVHRDIKPSNILFDQQGTPWLADWGLVKSEFSELTQTGDLFGSLAYMAPERFKGQADAKSDIYSLGVTLYELLTLDRLFDQEDKAELVGRIVNDEPRRPSEVVPTISADFENVILKAIEKRPAARYQDAARFADDLRNVFLGRPVSARKLNSSEKLIRWCRRQPVVASLTALVGLLLICGTAISSMFAVQAVKAKRLAEQNLKQSDDSLDMFFGTFFPQAVPEKGAKMYPMVRRTMDKAVTEIKQSPQFDPIVVGKLFNKLGWIYFNQQDYDKALDVFQHACDTVTQSYGEDEEVAMTALDHVGMTLMRQDRYEEAEEVLLKAWKLQKETLGQTHENTIHSYAKLGDLYLYMGRFDEAIRITREVLQLRTTLWGRDYKFSLVSKNGLANAYIEKEQPQKAISLLKDCIEVKHDKREYDLGLAYNYHNLARAYRETGNYQEAMRSNDLCLEIRLNHLENNSDSLLAARTLKCGLQADMDQSESALAELEKIWNDAQAAPHLKVRKAMILLELGLCHKRLGHNKEAKHYLESAHEQMVEYRTVNSLYARKAAKALIDLGD